MKLWQYSWRYATQSSNILSVTFSNGRESCLCNDPLLLAKVNVSETWKEIWNNQARDSERNYWKNKKCGIKIKILNEEQHFKNFQMCKIVTRVDRAAVIGEQSFHRVNHRRSHVYNVTKTTKIFQMISLLWMYLSADIKDKRTILFFHQLNILLSSSLIWILLKARGWEWFWKQIQEFLNGHDEALKQKPQFRLYLACCGTRGFLSYSLVVVNANQWSSKCDQ